MEKLVLPTLRGRMGDWYYYVTLMSFKEVANRISLADEIHKNKGLSRMIQRKVSDRTIQIVEYLNTQEQRFFNSLILGIYGGEPHWQEIDIENNKNINESEIEYLNRTFGILTLNGEENIFAIDGQHRSKAIKDAIKENKKLENEEIAVIFLAHNKSRDGEIRTRRLFSTLNRYAKPVNISEIIALDEEDNCAIITRNIVEEFELLKDKILFNQNRSINPKNKGAFTNIIVLYDLVSIILLNKNIFGIKVSGEDKNVFTKRRASIEIIDKKQNYVQDIIIELFENIPALNEFLTLKVIDREDWNTSLLFRPIGQNILFSVLKISINNSIKDKAINFFVENDFNLNNNIWKSVFIDEEAGTLKTDKYIQKYVTQLILMKIGVELKLTEKDIKIHKNFGIDKNDI